MQAQTRIIWLKVASDVVVLFGILIAFASLPSTAAPALFLADLIFWPVDGVQAVTSETNRLLSAILGGVMVGWGLLLYLLTTRLYPRDPDLARLLITASIGTWFFVDSLGSIAAGASLNALFNLGFLALFMIPLWLPGSPSTLQSTEPVSAKQ